MSEHRNNLTRHLLTDRQLEILELTYQGELTPEEIAAKLFIELRTVRGHIEKIKKQYNAPSFTIAVIKYVKEKYPPVNQSEFIKVELSRYVSDSIPPLVVSEITEVSTF